MAGVPFAGVLTAVMLVLCIAQIGPLLVLLAGTAWLFANGSQRLGQRSCWSGRFAVGLMDNFLRPMLISRGADLPLLLIFAGVIGGLLSFGLIGLFVGPVVLAVTYTLVDTWVHAPRAATPSPRASPGRHMSLNWLLVFVPVALVLEMRARGGAAGVLRRRPRHRADCRAAGACHRAARGAHRRCDRRSAQRDLR